MSRRRVGRPSAAPVAARPTRDGSPNGRPWSRAAVGRRSDRTEDVPTAAHRFVGRPGHDIPHGDPCVRAPQNRSDAPSELRLRKREASTRGAAALPANGPRRRDRRPAARPGHLHARIHRANHRRPCDGSRPAGRHRLHDPGHRSRLAHRDHHDDHSHPAHPGRRCGRSPRANRCRLGGRIDHRRRLAAVDRRWNENRRGSRGRARDMIHPHHGARIRAEGSGHGWGRSPSLRGGDGTRPSAGQLGLLRRFGPLSAVRRRRWTSDRAKCRRLGDDHADRHRSETTGIRRRLVPGDPAAGDDAARRSERSRLPVCRSRLLLSSWRVEPSLCFLLQPTPLTRNGHPSLGGHLTKKSGGVLLSHRVPPAVPSAQRVLASGFGM